MRVLRRIGRALALALLVVAAAVLAVVIVSQTGWFKERLRGYIVRQAGNYLNGSLAIQRLGGDLISGIELEDVAISLEGREVVTVSRLSLEYSVLELLSRGLAIDRLELTTPTVRFWRDGDSWSIGRLVKEQEQEADRSGPSRPASIAQIVVTDGSVVFDDPLPASGVSIPKRFDRLNAALAFAYEPVRYSIEITNVAFRGSEPALDLNGLSGGISVRDDTLFLDQIDLRTAASSLSLDGTVRQYLTDPALNLRLRSEKISFPELAPVVPALAGTVFEPRVDLALDGPLSHLNVELNVQSTAGALAARLVTDVAPPGHAAAGQVSVRQLDVGAIRRDLDNTDITFDAQLDLRAASLDEVASFGGAVSLNAARLVVGDLIGDELAAEADIHGLDVDLKGRLRAYGAAATTEGTIRLPEGNGDPARIDLRGQALRVNLEGLPRRFDLPRTATDLNVSYRVNGVAPSSSRTARGRLDVVFAPSSAVGVSIAEGSTIGLSVADDVSYEVDAAFSGLDLQRVGVELDVPSLAVDRYRTTVNGRVAGSGRGTALRDLELKASAALRESEAIGGTIPEVNLDVAVEDDTVALTANGSFAGLDPAVASQKPAAMGAVSGSLDANVVVSGFSRGISYERIDGAAQVSLSPSRVGELDLDSAALDGSFRRGTADIRSLAIEGTDLNARASGLLAIGDEGESNLQVHVDSPDLEKIGSLAGAGESLSGIAAVDMTVTGNRSMLYATGRLSGSGVRYGPNGALAVSSDFQLSLRDLDIQGADVSATTRGTFVTVAGQDINQLTAQTDYSRQQLVFEVDASQPDRSVDAAGALTMHPDHQEMHLRRFALTSQGVLWETMPGSEATIRYANDAIEVDELWLSNGTQSISASGAFGRPDDSLIVMLTDVEVGTIDALLLRPPQLSGLLSGTATISGSKDAPEVEGDFLIEAGGFRQFRYESFGGTVKYTPEVVSFSAKLQQNPTAWIETQGQLPGSLLNGSAPTTGDQPVDLRIDSTPIDVGIVQGFTTALTNVTGTAEAHVRVTGTAADLRPDGMITIDNAAFRLEPNGVEYTDLDARIALQPDRIQIEQITLLDNRKSPLTVRGDLAIVERAVGEMFVALSAEDFKVIDNPMGNVRVNANLQLTGQVNAPRIEGEIGLTTGEINLDPILAALGSGVYSTSKTEFAAPDGSGGDDTAPSSEPSATAPFRVDVRLTIPNDLVVQAADWRAPGSPISLGDLNLTLGGDLYLHQVPYDRLRLYGSINTVRGTYAFQGRQFTILRDGTIRFEGLDEFDPALDLRTERVIQGVTANVNVQGRFSRPEIVLTSVPPLDQADILSLIVFNQPINQLGTGEQISLAARAQALATGAVASQLANSIGAALGIDAFEISTAPDSGAQAEVTIGQQVGQNLYVRLKQGIGDQAQTNFILEYELAEWLRLRTNVVEGSPTQQQAFRRAESTGFDMLFFFSY